MAEGRFLMLARTDPEHAQQLLRLAQADVDERWRYFEQRASITPIIPHDPHEDGAFGPTPDNTLVVG